MAKVAVHSTKSWYGTRYLIYLDGKRIGVIKNGDTESFDVAPGDHTLQLNRFNSFHSRKIPFSIAGSEEIDFETKVTWYIILQWLIIGIFLLIILPFAGDFIKSLLTFLPVSRRLSFFVLVFGPLLFLLH